MSVRIDAGQFIGLFSVKNLFQILNEERSEKGRRSEEPKGTGERYLPQLAIMSEMTG